MRTYLLIFHTGERVRVTTLASVEFRGGTATFHAPAGVIAHFSGLAMCVADTDPDQLLVERQQATTTTTTTTDTKSPTTSDVSVDVHTEWSAL